MALEPKYIMVGKEVVKKYSSAIEIPFLIEDLLVHIVHLFLLYLFQIFSPINIELS